ncbi:MAG: conjugal transfer protein TrbH [Rhizobiaceae bacterium]|nr:conjugal transfer protein TrbH [Rhizobiaceae bacterium]
MLPSIPALRLIKLLFVAALLAGCQTLGGAGLIQSASQAELSPQAAEMIAGDLVGRLAEYVGPGSTTIQLRTDGSPFGQALENTLKQWGYAVVTDQNTSDPNVVPLAYVIDTFETSVLGRLSTTSLNLTRMYSLTVTDASPVSPLSVMRIGQEG